MDIRAEKEVTSEIKFTSLSSEDRNLEFTALRPPLFQFKMYDR